MPKSFYIEDQVSSQPAILLVDASNSVLVNQFPETHLKDVTIWKKMLTIAEQLPNEQFRVLFWNTTENEGGFAKDAMVVPYVVEKKKLAGWFELAKLKINEYCTTQ